MKYESVKLVAIAEKVNKNKKLSVKEINYLSGFTHLKKDSLPVTILKNSALPLSLLLGFFFTVYPEFFEQVIETSPAWTNLSPRLLAGIDYFWDIIGEPVGKQNILYHLPNVVFYSFGVLGVKKLFDSLNRRSWLDSVIDAQKIIKEKIADGTLNLSLAEGHSVLFVGRGDFIGMQFILNHKKSQAVTISEVKPAYTDIWNYYDVKTGYEDLKVVLKR